MSAANLQSVYVECGLHKLTRWRGREVMLAPADIVEIQDIVYQTRPDRIVAVNVNPGIVFLLDSFLAMTGLNHSRIVLAGNSDSDGEALPPSVDRIDGDPYAAETLAAVERALGLEEKILVLFAPRADDYRPIDPLRAYSQFVSCRSYLICLGTVFGQPWLGYSKYWLQSALKTIAREGRFVIDRSRNQQLVTTCPDGYLQRILDNSLPATDAGRGEELTDI
jgi:cephalosporin hydroxylase